MSQDSALKKESDVPLLNGLHAFRYLLMKGRVLIPEAEVEPTSREMDPGGKENFTFDLSGTEAQTLLI